MTLEDVQNDVDGWVQQFKISYWDPLAIVARLAEETGEVAREVNHLYGPKKKKETEGRGNLAGELADVIFTVCCMANREGVDLQKAWEEVMAKHYGRDNTRYERKEQ